jgi:pyruvate/2-oxoacid:ferredoxin oxidoreductase beta subunit
MLQPAARDQQADRASGCARPVAKNDKTPAQTFIKDVTHAVNGFSPQAKEEFFGVIDKVPMAFHKANAIFATPEKKSPGSGGIFSIFVSDLCKGCAACVTACGEHQALRMVQETEEVNAEHESGTAFLNLLPDTMPKYLGLYNDSRPQDSKTATLRNMLMVRRNYDALVSGDGACAGCGEKSILRACAAVTEAYMRPIYHAKADRFRRKADELEKAGEQRLADLKARSADEYELFKQAVAHLLMGLGGEDDKDTRARMKAHGEISDKDLVGAITAVLRHEAFLHKNLQAIDGRAANGMSVMAMAAHTGCNTVYGSTPPNNPHPYPWMNSLFQDGITVGWLLGESFIVDHGRRSVIPERLLDALMTREKDVITPRDYYEYVHFSDAVMTDQEIIELPKAWVVGGDGGMGDIGYQNMSKVILQNRPNVKAVMLDTQVYSNTGGQNSDSTPMLGGNDMNMFGTATQGKNVEKKTVAETFLAGHGSPFVAQVSIANAPKLYRAILDGLEYRGTAFFQCFTTCQPEHGVADDLALTQAQRVRDSRGAPEFVFNPRLGESYQEVLDIKGQSLDRHGLVRNEVQADQRAVPLHGRALVRNRGAVQKPSEEGQAGRGGKADPAREHARSHHAAGRRLPALPGQGSPVVRPRLRRLHQGAGRQRRRVPIALASTGAVLRGAAQGVAHAAEQGGHREPRVQSAARHSRGRRRGEDHEGAALCRRRGADEGEARKTGGTCTGPGSQARRTARVTATENRRRRRRQLGASRSRATTDSRVGSADVSRVVTVLRLAQTAL